MKRHEMWHPARAINATEPIETGKQCRLSAATQVHGWFFRESTSREMRIRPRQSHGTVYYAFCNYEKHSFDLCPGFAAGLLLFEGRRRGMPASRSAFAAAPARRLPT